MTFQKPLLSGAKRTRLKILVGVCFVCVAGLFTLQWVRVSLSARFASLFPAEQSLQAYGASVAKFETLGTDAHTGRALLGFGFSSSFEAVLKESSPAFQKCRQYFREGTGPVLFQVKVRAKQQRVQVLGVLRGMEENAPHAVCLRDTLESVPFAFLSETPQVSDESYTLHVLLASALHAGVSGGR